jgi:hypothetical protein
MTILPKKIANMAGGLASVVEHLLSHHEALSSNPTTAKKMKKLQNLVSLSFSDI